MKRKTLLAGKRILEVRPMTPKELQLEGWYRGVAIVLDDGTIAYPSSDSEGNEGGSLFVSHRGKSYVISEER